MGQVFYRDWIPGENDVTYNANGALPQIESWVPNVPKQLPFQPESYFDNRLSAPDYYLANIQKGGYTLDELYPYPYAVTYQWFSPPQPIARDLYTQLAAKVQNRAVAGQAPTQGIYTGVEDIGL